MTNKELLADTLAYLSAGLSNIAEDLYSVADMIERDEQDFYPRGTILKATPEQTRFKPKSMWVSQGDGTYKHLNGKKGLVTTHDRLNGYTEVIFSA
jgi:poly(3-hydroxyalkanoate) synthetase